MLANRHYMLDAYGCYTEQANSVMVVNDMLVHITTELEMHPVMPPFVLPYYYCNDAEDVGISAFCICENGSHITIHTFPYRSCYFVDILTDKYFSETDVTEMIKSQIYANKITTSVVDRRVFEGISEKIDRNYDFGPHYMITVNDVDASMESIFKWLDNIAPTINMLSISRPYVVFDKTQNPEYISGILVVAQSHIAFHYSVTERVANIDIFSCSFLENGLVENLIQRNFGTETKLNLFTRGSKHHIACEVHSRQSRIKKSNNWRQNI